MDGTENRNSYVDTTDINNSDVIYPFFGTNTYIEIFSNGKLVFEGKYTIYEYLNEKITVKIGKKFLNISGARLRLKNVSSQGFSVVGKINIIEFE